MNKPVKTDTLPPPPVPGDADLRQYPYVPIWRTRLFNSDFHARATDAEWRAGVTLWLKSWEQVPAGSLPDDEAALCRLAEFGRDVAGWKTVADRAMHGWYKCSDGRLYHPVVAEVVVDALATKKGNANRTAAARAARMSQPLSQTMSQPNVTEHVARHVTHDVTVDVTNHATDHVTSVVTGSNREGKGEGNQKGVVNGKPRNLQRNNPLQQPSAEAARETSPFKARFEAVCTAMGVATSDLAVRDWPSQINAMIAEGLDLEKDILPACAEARRRAVTSLQWARKRAEGERAKRVPPQPVAIPRRPDDKWRWDVKIFFEGLPEDDRRADGASVLPGIKKGFWRRDLFGPAPREGGCLVPAHIVAEFEAVPYPDEGVVLVAIA